MRFRYPKTTYWSLAIAFGLLVSIGLVMEIVERTTWPASVPNSGVTIIADSDGDTQARATQIVQAIEQFERVNGVSPGALRQLKPTYIDKILMPLDPVRPWEYDGGTPAGWVLYYKDPDYTISWTEHTYSSRSRKWESKDDGF